MVKARQGEQIQGWLDPSNEVESEIIKFKNRWIDEQESLHGFRVSQKDFIVHACQVFMEHYTGDLPPTYKSTEPVLNHKTMQIIDNLRDIQNGFATVLDQLRTMEFSPAQNQALDNVQHQVDLMGKSLASAFDDEDLD